MQRLSVITLALAAAAFGACGADLPYDEATKALLAADECQDEECALNAIQLRGLMRTEVRSDATETSDASEVDGAREHDDFAAQRVFVMRHCVRSLPLRSEYQLYASPKLSQGPPWRTPEYWCTGGGYEISKNTGAFLRTEFGAKLDRVQVISDDVMRDSQTSLGVLEGLGGKATQPFAVTFNSSVFKPRCAPANESTQLAEARQLLRTTPLPMGVGLLGSPGFDARWRAALQRFRVVLGEGEKNLLELQPPTDSDFHWVAKKGKVKLGGSAMILKYFAQQIAYSWSSAEGDVGTPIVYGDPPLDPAMPEVFAIYDWVFYERHISNPPSRLTTQGVSILDTLYRALQSKTGLSPGWMQILTGHNGDLDALQALLNISWQIPEYTSLGPHTPPLTGLMFSREKGDIVTVQVVWTQYDGTVNGSQPTYASVKPGRFSLKDLRHRIREILSKFPAAEACAKQVGATF